MPKKTNNINTESLHKLKDQLASLQTKPKTLFSTREAIAELEAAIRSALGLGYNLLDIAEMLEKEGLNIAPSTLSTYLRELAKKQKPKKKSNKTENKKAAQQPAKQTQPASAEQTADSEQKFISSPFKQLNEADDFIELQATPFKGLPTSRRPSDG